MTKKEIADYYNGLSKGEKGRFIAFLSLSLGSSPHTWQTKILRWGQNKVGRPLSPVIDKELCSIIQQKNWR